MGFLRLFLALCVVAAHSNDVSFSFGGREAVLLFYVISGFYMSLVLNEKYKAAADNLIFYQNRYLRLWVPYVVVMFFVLIGYYHSGDLKIYTTTYSDIPFAAALYGLLSNLFIIGQDMLWFVSIVDHEIIFRPMGHEGFNGVNLSLNAPLFTVGLELYFYLLAPFILRDKRRTYIFALVGLSYHIVLAGLHVTSLGLTYHAFPATIAYFGLGGALYHWSRDILGPSIIGGKNKLCAWVTGWQRGDRIDWFCVPAIIALFLVINTPIPKILLAATIFGLPLLFALTRHWRLDRMVGELSYGVYIIHFPLIQIANKSDGDLLGIGQFASTVVLALGFSLLLYWLIERPLNRYRARRFVGR
jgi:peptidoglycan/LPS O-acetylase OafA/YrhL